MTIDQFCAKLRATGMQGVDSYQQRLRENEKDQGRLQDFAYEGQVALIFSQQGWSITMRDRPDLEGQLNGIHLGIEVKHFRYKPAHDPIEEAALRWEETSEEETLALLPSLRETEGREEAWEQMFRFAQKNAHQYLEGEFNLIFFWCSTQAYEEGTLITAANMYDEAIQNASRDSAMKNLTAMMMNSNWAKVGDDARSMFWAPIRHAKKPITPELCALLEEIRNT